jgi:molybdate transport system substrate-binding protein
LRWRAVHALLVMAFVAACGSSSAASGSARTVAVDLTIFAASSLTAVLDDVKVAYASSRPETGLAISTDSSAALATQIEQGAPADVFLSADTANPQKLVRGGFSAGEAVTFAANRLTIVIPADNPAGLSSPADLAKPGLKVIAAGDEVPISAYAKQLLANLAKEPGYPAGFEAAYAANIVSKEDNVGAVMGKIAIGEGDAAIVYVTDAKASTDVTTIPLPDGTNVTTKYAGIVVGTSPDQEPARMFLGWLTGLDGQAVLSRFGFLPPLT